MSKVLAVLATFVVALFGAHIARADADFTDPASDASGAPDVTDVSVFNDAFNRVVFAARIAGGKAMEADSEITFVIDADQNPETGGSGWDYWIVLDGAKKWNLFSWDGTQWIEAPATTVKTSFVDDIVLFGIDRSELGNTASFDFFVESNKLADDQPVATDTAPDGDGLWSYATVTKTFGLAASPVVVVTKGGARVGKPFVAGATKAVIMRDYAEKHGIDLARSYAYSDSYSDYPMLAVVGHPTAVNPDWRLRATARSYDWPVLDLS